MQTKRLGHDSLCKLNITLCKGMKTTMQRHAQTHGKPSIMQKRKYHANIMDKPKQGLGPSFSMLTYGGRQRQVGLIHATTVSIYVQNGAAHVNVGVETTLETKSMELGTVEVNVGYVVA